MLLGIDVGTTAVKALLIDAAARVVTQAGVEYPLHTPRPGWSEQDPADWWAALVSAVRQVVGEAGGDGVRAVAVSTQGDTMVPLDAAGRPLCPARTWMDTRAADLVGGFDAALAPAQWRAIAGAALGPHAAAMTIVWLREHLPEVYRRAARFALVGDFIVERLTGAPALDEPNASRTLLFDIRLRRWSARLMELVGVDEARLSPVLPSATVAGELTAAAARELGLRPGTPVAVGGHDQTCAAVGAGVVRPHTMLLSCGTAWVLLASIAQPLLDQATGAVHTYCHAVPERWALLTAHAGGNILSWLRTTLYTAATPYDEIVAGAERAATAADSSLLVLPHFYGSQMPASQRHARGALLGLTLSSTRDDLALGVLRGVALEVARNFRFLSAIGATTDEVRMIGGGASSRFWAQTIADATGVRVVRPRVREAAAFGAAVLAGVAAGVFASVEEVVGSLPAEDALTPDTARSARYQEQLGLFTAAIDALGPVWAASTAPPP